MSVSDSSELLLELISNETSLIESFDSDGEGDVDFDVLIDDLLDSSVLILLLFGINIISLFELGLILLAKIIYLLKFKFIS